MRELTLEELELIAGGTRTGDEGEIVVTGDGDSGDSGDWGDWGDWGDTDSGDGGGGDGGGDSGTGEPPQEPQEEIVVIGARPTATCPVNDWWPNFLEDWGDVKVLGNSGPWEQFWTDGNTWCFYDGDDNLMGQFVQDPEGKFNITFNVTDGDPAVSAGGWGFSGGVATNDSDGASYTIPLRQVY